MRNTVILESEKVNKDLKILIVDDDPEIRDISKFYFESITEFGVFKFIEADSGNQGIQLLNEHPDLDLVFSDFNMPNGNGIKLLIELRKVSQAPFLLHTGDDFDRIKEVRAYENVFHAEKPVDIEKLTRILKSAFSKTIKKAG